MTTNNKCSSNMFKYQTVVTTNNKERGGPEAKIICSHLKNTLKKNWIL